MRALVVDACGLRGALGGVRGLGQAGWHVGVATACPPGLAGSSRWCDTVHAIPRAADEPEAFVDAVTAVAGAYDVVLPAGDAEVMTLSRHRDRLDAVLPYPPHPVLEAVLDKQGLSDRATAAGLATPRIVDVAEVEAGTAEPPLVVKQRWQGTDTTARWETVRVDTVPDLHRQLDAMAAAGLVPLLQEVVEGALLALSVLVHPDGEVVAAVQSVGDPATWPVRTGMRLRSRTVTVDPQLLESVRTMLVGAGWWGIADVDFLAPPDGPPRLIDCNGRLFASMAVAGAAGVNFPDLWARTALGLPVGRHHLGVPGVRYQWLEGELRRALATRGGIGAVASALRFAMGATHTSGRLADPRPGLGRLTQLARGAVARRRG